jgi:hypothetical protein
MKKRMNVLLLVLTARLWVSACLVREKKTEGNGG